MPVPVEDGGGRLATIAAGLKSKLSTLFSGGEEAAETGTIWRHPAKGTGQIVDRLEEEIKKHGGEILYQTDVTAVESKGNRLTRVVCKAPNGETIEFEPQNVIGSIPIELLAKLILVDDPLAQKKAEVVMPRSAALVYIFLDGPPPFPHFFLEVSDPDLQCGRIVNYNALGGDMVPPGKTGLCVEFFCDSTDPLMKLSEAEIGELALKECEASGILNREKVVDLWPLKFPGADAATDYRDWMTAERRQLLNSLSKFENLYFVNRAGTDAASYAGLEAARAIMSGDRKSFDKASDPRHSLKT
jgi:protoporphyrinogen oxidase